jgi:hypothetical protein
MSKNYINLDLGGEKRGIKFSMGTLEHLESITGEDPYKFAIRTDNVKDFLRDATIVIYAGLLSNSDAKREEPQYTKEDVSTWVRDLGFSEIMSILQVYQKAYSSTASQEGGTDTQ